MKLICTGCKRGGSIDDCQRSRPLSEAFYGLKTIDAVFVVEPDRIVVITVKVYYHD